MNTFTKDDTKYDDRIEAVITCSKYADFLRQTIPFTISQVDRLVVVTPHEDHETRRVCDEWSVECIVSDSFTEKGDVFNKGSAINIGLAGLRQKGWILHMDADIVLPVTFRNMLDKAALQRDHIYGANRANIRGYHKWQEFKKTLHEVPQFSYRYLVGTPHDLPIGDCVVHKQYGYVPIGFFQLWHSTYMHRYQLRYPDSEGSAEHMDVQWSLRWPRHKRHIVPTIRVFHLESDDATAGVNWRGRKSAYFGPRAMG